MTAERGAREKGVPQGPLRLTDAVRTKLIEAVRNGAPAGTAATFAGVSRRALFNWLAKGKAEEERRAEDLDPDTDLDCYVTLWEEVTAAKAEAEVRAIVQLQTAARGGTVTERTTKRYFDTESGEWVEETTEKMQPPDWRANSWYLERSNRSEWGKDAMQVELTGAGGGAVQVEGGIVDPDALASKIVDNIAALAAGAAAAAAEIEAVTLNYLDDPRTIDGTATDSH